ncbi:MAG: hypothetical protein LKG27_02655 [Clostridiaceae bacterium]|jgi:VIT1/CCC1 family predicted Fe2+/Mn2+ transporter|nr:hypothetical protein [Clostridiaceae bacterium]
MINQVPIAKVNSKSAYADFSNNKNQFLFTSPQSGDEFTLSEDKKGKKKSKKALIIASTVAGTVLVVLGFVSGLHKGAYKWLEKLRGHLNQKMSTKGAREKSEQAKQFYRVILSGVNHFLEKAESLNNFHSLKIISMKKSMCAFSNSTPKNAFGRGARKVYEGITNFFEKISRRTVLSSYKKSDKTLNKMLKYTEKINSKLNITNPSQQFTINGVTKTKEEWVKEIERHLASVKTGYKSNFKGSALDDRYNRMHNVMSDLDVRFWDASLNPKGFRRNFTSREMYQSFLAHNLVVEDRTKLINEVSQFRRGITNDITDITTGIKSSLSEVENAINPKDSKSIEQITILKAHLKEYANLSGNNEVTNRAKLADTLKDDFKALQDRISENSGLYDSDVPDRIITKLGDTSALLEDTKKGEIQEILTIYKEILPRKDYIKMRNKICSFNKSLHKSINLECAQFFDKMRDLAMGSAPLEVSDILFGVVPLSYFLIRAKDNDKRKSISLKYGIPALTSLGTIVYCTTSLLSGGKAMAFGIITGYLTHKIGKFADKYRLEHKKTPSSTAA